RAGGLDHLDIVELYHKMKSILKLACRRNAYYKIYPEDWFWEWRKAGTEIPGVGKVKKMKVGGRSTYYVESLQKRVI
ncbi:MAG: DNA-(apurinic or apyrimidinic site) lyase, partial [Saprospiraceae bacterium]|nr:DNA-(apurinic or apyrimidinic site) lyase [Saprospiraceae bacterium]